MLFSLPSCVRILTLAGIALLGFSDDPVFAQASKSPPSKKKAMQRERARQEAGSIDGAIWAFQLTPSKGGPGREKLSGRYRISDLVVYQAEEPGEEMDVEVGASEPNEKTKATSVNFDYLWAKDSMRRWKKLEGKAVLSPKKLDVWEGEFVDSDGFRWKMSVTRARE